jgi:hypothetical protein
MAMLGQLTTEHAQRTLILLQKKHQTKIAMSRLPRSTKGGFIPTRIHVLAQKIILKYRKRRFARQFKMIGLLFAVTIISTLYYSKCIQSSALSLHQRKANPASFGMHSDTTAANKKCALLFFGLIKDSFQTISLPSIKRNILDPNLQCDIFLHTYNLTDVPLNKRNAELTVHKVNVSHAYLLTNNVVLEEMNSFHEKRKTVLEHTRKFYHRGWGECCSSHDNMIKQWNSIQGVWDLMQQYEQKNGNSNGNGKHSKYYDQVGLFRSDVYYTRPIDIFDSKGAVPSFALHHGYNDRLFYGSYENARIWASQRFEFVDTFEKKYMKFFNLLELDKWSRIKSFLGYKYKDGYHSESFVKNLMDHSGINVELKDICVWRVRTGQKILAGDCDGMSGFSTFGEVKSYRPKKNESGVSWSMVVE